MNNNTINTTEKRNVTNIKKMVFRDLKSIKATRPAVVNPGLKYLVR